MKLYTAKVEEIIKRDGIPTLELRIRIPTIHGSGSNALIKREDLPIAKPLLVPGAEINTEKFINAIETAGNVLVSFQGRFTNPYYLGTLGEMDDRPLYIDFPKGERNEFQTARLYTEDVELIKITIIGGANSDVPVNIRNYKINGVIEEPSRLPGTSIEELFDYKIGNLDALANKVNSNVYEGNNDLRLHSWHKNIKTESYIEIDVTGTKEFTFDYAVTTTAHSSFGGMRVYIKYKRGIKQ